ncbi:MAG: AraC family transcriptional regulator [Clostridia bacterium]|nr:AraC family transcriptional regulator [Clostridia bacterium]
MTSASDSIDSILDDLSHIAGCGACFVDCLGKRMAGSRRRPTGRMCSVCPAGLSADCAYLSAFRGKDEERFIYADVYSSGVLAGRIALGRMDDMGERNGAALDTLAQAFACLIEKRGLARHKSELFAELSRYIDDHLSDDLSAQSLISTFYFSQSVLSKTVKRESGMPLRMYIQSRRLEAARVLLMGNSMPVMQAAVQCGISDFNYFSRIFKRRFGISPSELKAMARRDFH